MGYDPVQGRIMNKIGIVGGLGPESTITYYQGIITAFQPTYEALGYPEIVIESVDLRTFMQEAELGSWDRITHMLVERCDSLKAAGAQFGAIASNTPHRVFDKIQEATSLPLLSIVEATRRHVLELGIYRVCLLGTQITMESDFYQQVLQASGIAAFVPNPREITYIQEKIFAEIEFGILKEDTRAGFLDIIRRLESDHGVEGVILGCTELPMLLKPEDLNLHTIDTTAIHIAAIVDRCREE
jgi:aspartate racemase